MLFIDLRERFKAQTCNNINSLRYLLRLIDSDMDDFMIGIG